MEERLLDLMNAPPTTKNMETLVEQMAKGLAGVRITTDTKVWAGGKYGYLLIILDDDELNTSPNGTITPNTCIDRPVDIHEDTKDNSN